jgi:hypothetical protein
VLERLIESWLDSASERSYQAPFCQMLAAEGHLVVHSTRHSPIEFGKDIISIDPEGIPCAFQLKGNPGGRLTLNQLRDIKGQLLELVTQPIVHPGVPKGSRHRCYLVTNGETEEEVHRSLDDINRELENLGFGANRMELWSRGRLLEMATRLGASLWPSELEDLNTLLEILVHRGDDLLPIEKFDKLFKRLLKLEEDDSTKLFASEGKRRISSAAVLTAVALRNFSLKENHYATIAAWTIFVAYTISACERHQLRYQDAARAAVEIAKDTIFDALSSLCDEVKDNQKLLTSGPEIAPIYMGRATVVFALLSLYWLWSREREWPVAAHKTFLDAWLPKDHSQSFLWGEGAVPQYLAQYWYFSSVDPTWRSEGQLGSLLFAIIKMKLDYPGQQFPSPYFGFEDFLKHLLAGFLQSGQDPLRDETAHRMSFMAEGVMHLFVRTNLKQTAKQLWPGYTNLGLKRFEVEETWNYCLYRTDRGKEIMTLPLATKQWDDLVNEARECRVMKVPAALAKEKWILALFIVLLPYRATPEVIRYLGRQLGTVWCVATAIED